MFFYNSVTHRAGHAIAVGLGLMVVGGSVARAGGCLFATQQPSNGALQGRRPLGRALTALTPLAIALLGTLPLTARV